MEELNVSVISNEKIRTTLFETIAKKLKTDEFVVCLKQAAVLGVAGSVYHVLFHEKSKPENSTKKLILKVAPQSEAHRAQFFIEQLYTQEVFVYDEILTHFRDFERSKGINPADSFTEYPECYQTIVDPPNECLLMEDLTVRGFRMIDQYTEEITADHVQLVMKAFAKFHAVSFALKDQQPQKFTELASNIKEMFMRTNDPFFRGFFQKQFQNALTVLSKEEDADLRAKVEPMFEKDAIDLAAELIDVKNMGNGVVILHGDTHYGNILFRNDNNGKPVELSIIDWQGSRVSSPIYDLLYMIFVCAKKDVRDLHYEEFLTTYYENLAKHISRLGSDPEKLFPYSEFMEHLKKFAKYILIIATIYLPGMTKDKDGEEDKGIELKDSKGEDFLEGFLSENSKKRYEQRLRDVIVDLARLGYI